MQQKPDGIATIFGHRVRAFDEQDERVVRLAGALRGWARKPGAEVTSAEIRDHVKSLIAGYKAPRTVEFVDVLPATPTGKVLKRELRAKYWAGTERGVN